MKRLFLTLTCGLTLTFLWLLSLSLIAQAADPDPGLTAPPFKPFDQPTGQPHPDHFGQANETPLDAPATVSAQTALAQLPLRFIPNEGQTDPAVRFHVHSLGGSLFFSAQGVVFSLPAVKGQGSEIAPYPNRKSKIINPKSVVRLTFDGANPSPTIEGLTPLPGGANFFLGNDPARWQSNLPTYEGIIYRNLYPGIDLVYRGSEGQLKSEFVVAPGADPGQIRLRYEGAESLSVRDDGALVIQTAAGELVEAPLLIYQEVNGVRREIEGRYLLPDNHKHAIINPLVTFQIAAYDPTLPLIIDPELVYSSYLGGNDYEQGLAITVDNSGNIFVTGQTASPNFPVQQPLQGDRPNADVYVTKIITTNGVYTYGYSTYLGGSGEDIGYSITVDSAGNIYLTGYTGSSTDFPTRDAIQNTCASCVNVVGDTDAFVTKIISVSGVYTLGFSTYLGGNATDTGYGITVDSAGNIFVTGTAGTNFPTRDTLQSFQGVGDSFVTKIISASGVYTYGFSTYLGGNDFDESNAIAVDDTGNIYIGGLTDSTNFPTFNALQGNQTGRDAFVTKLIRVGGVYTYAYSTYLGGNNLDASYDMTIDNTGNVYLTGVTQSSDFPTVNQLQNNASTDNSTAADVFVTKIISDSGVYTYAYSTYLGGSSNDSGYGIAVDSKGNAYITGQADSANFPANNVIQNMCVSFPSCIGGFADAFITEIISTSGIYTYGYSTHLGGSGLDFGIDIVADDVGSAYVIGHTTSTNFPTQNAIQATRPGGSQDAFITKISPALPATCFAQVNSTSATFNSSNAQAVQQAVDAASSGDLVKLAGYCAGVSTRAGLTQTVYLNKPLTLRGGYTSTNWTTSFPLTQPTTLDAQSAGRVAVITNSVSATITAMTLINGNNVVPNSFSFTPEGGGIWNGGNLFLQQVTLTNNIARGVSEVAFLAIDGKGGGIYNKGTLSLQQSNLISNSVYGGTSTFMGPLAGNGNGGGIWNEGSLTLSDTTVSSNSAIGLTFFSGVGSGQGGGIFNASPGGVMTLTNSFIYSNTATKGGGINNSGVLTLSNSIISTNTATGTTKIPTGGGLFNSGSLLLTKTVVRDNKAQGFSNAQGGGLQNEGGNVTLNSSAIISNNTRLEPGPVSMGEGGGIYNLNGTVVLNNSTLSSNINNGVGGLFKGQGGGIYNNQGSITLNNSSVVSNTTIDAGGGIYNLNSGGSTINLKNTLVAGNRAYSTSSDCYNGGVFNSLGYNLIGNNTNCVFSPTNGDQVGTGSSPIDPKLGPLQDNGGQTFTRALLPGSPAINAGDPTACAAAPINGIDQRGFPRDAACDIGAYEATAPVLSLTKTANLSTVTPGDRITYTLIISNIGPVSATQTIISDTLPNGLTFAGPVTLNPPGAGIVGTPPTLVNNLSIAAGQRITVTFPVTVNSNLSGGTVITNIAAVNSAQVSKSVTGTAVITIANIPAIIITKTVNINPASIGDTITYTYRVTNTGNTPLNGLNASDDKLGQVVLSQTTLTPNQSTTGLLTYTVVEADLPGPLTNTVVITGTPPTGPLVTASNIESVALTSNPAITISKTASLTAAQVGQTITYTYRVTNTGNVTLNGLSASDDKLEQVTLSQTTLTPNQSTSGVMTYTVVEADLPGPLTNTVVITGTPPTGPAVTASDTESVALTPNPAITITKQANVNTADVGDTITYTYRVTNTGNVTLNDLNASDDKLGQIILSQTTLTPNQNTSGLLTYTVVEADLPGPLTNTVVITGTPPTGPLVTASDIASVALTSNSIIIVTKSANVSTAQVGQAITYTYRVTNTGNVTLNDLNASDDKLGQITLSQTTLTPNQSTTGLLTYTVIEADLPGPLTNTVVVTGTPSSGPAVTASDTQSVALTSSPAITISKTASLTTAQVGQTITYTYRVTNTGNVTLSGLNAKDNKLGQISLNPASLAPHQSVIRILTYTIIAADLPGPLTNTVVVTGTPSSGPAVTAMTHASVTLIPPWDDPDVSIYLPLIIKNN